MNHVVVTGNIMPGYKKEDVVTNICELCDLSPEVVENKLMAGERITVKKLDDPDEAERYCMGLTCAGLVTEIEQH